jgi:ABC-2 type transport system ATP-binding protein
MTELAIECIGLGKSFGKRPAIQDVNLGVRKGSISALVGANGAGKTTLLKILATLIVPSCGTARICGEDIVAGDSIEIRRRIGFASSEERSFYWRLTGRQNLKFFASLHQLTGVEADRRIEPLLALSGLEEAASLPFRQYSTGMKQALGVARALLHDPPVLLLDEPSRSLSPDLAGRVHDLIRHEAKKNGKTILIASHNLNEVEKLCDETVVMHRGTVRTVVALEDAFDRVRVSTPGGLEDLFYRVTREADGKR